MPTHLTSGRIGRQIAALFVWLLMVLYSLGALGPRPSDLGAGVGIGICSAFVLTAGAQLWRSLRNPAAMNDDIKSAAIDQMMDSITALYMWSLLTVVVARLWHQDQCFDLSSAWLEDGILASMTRIRRSRA